MPATISNFQNPQSPDHFYLPENLSNPETFIHTLLANQEAIEAKYADLPPKTPGLNHAIHQEYEKLYATVAHYILDQQAQSISPKELSFFHAEIDDLNAFRLAQPEIQDDLHDFFQQRHERKYAHTKKYLLNNYDFRTLFSKALQSAKQLQNEAKEHSSKNKMPWLQNTENDARLALNMIYWNNDQEQSANPELQLPPTPPHLQLDEKHLQELLNLVKKLYGRKKFEQCSQWLQSSIVPYQNLGYSEGYDQCTSGFNLLKLFEEIQTEIATEKEQHKTAQKTQRVITNLI